MSKIKLNVNICVFQFDLDKPKFCLYKPDMVFKSTLRPILSDLPKILTDSTNRVGCDYKKCTLSTG